MRAGQGCAGRRGKTPGVGQPWGTARVGNTGQNHGGKAGRCVGRLSEGQLPAQPSSLSSCCRLLSLLAQLRLCCARQPPQPLLWRGQPPAPPASSRPCSSTATATRTQPPCFPDNFSLLQPWHCSSPSTHAAAMQLRMHFAQALRLSVVQTHPKSSREKPQKKQDISQLSEDYQKLGMHPHFITRNANPAQARCASCTHRWIKLLAGGWEVKEGILYFSPCDL